MRIRARAARLAARLAGLVAGLLLLITACGQDGADGGAAGRAPGDAGLWAEAPWDDVVEAARGTEVRWRMWRGDPSINAFIEGWVAPRLLEDYGITLRTVDTQGPEIVNQLVVEREARARGFADLVWINGETFHQLMEEGLLQGPWAHRIPNAALIDSTATLILEDFERPIAGWESPWGRVQFAMIYDTLRTPEPPQTVAELGAWIRANPGRFTHDQAFTGVTLLKGLMYALAGGHEAFKGGFSEEAYAAGSEALWLWLEAHTPFFWREGTVYPAGVAELHRLFANQEVDFSFSYNENEVVTKVRQGIFPPSARATLIRDATIANAHYLGIPFNAPNPAGAMVVANFLLGPEAQLEKQRPEVWGDGTVLGMDRLEPRWRDAFAALEADPAARAIPRDTLDRYGRPEVAPEYHIRILEDWRRRIRRGRGG
jgi:putative spermidine/putrescine transport system substrate-binding protein